MLSASVVTACAPFEKTSPFWGTITAGFGSADGNPVSREYADKLPYASMLAWFENGPKAFIVLAEANGDRLTWQSAERQSITTMGPFVVKSIGTELELRDTRISGLATTNLLELDGRAVKRVLDILAEGDRVSVEIEGTFAVGDASEITIMGKPQRVRAVTEHVRSGGRSRYVNQYWCDEISGRCWKSRQVIVPRMPPFNFEILKPPAETL